MAAPRALLAAVAVAALASAAAAFNETRVMTFNVLCQACVGDNYGTYVDEGARDGAWDTGWRTELEGRQEGGSEDGVLEKGRRCWRRDGGA